MSNMHQITTVTANASGNSLTVEGGGETFAQPQWPQSKDNNDFDSPPFTPPKTITAPQQPPPQQQDSPSKPPRQPPTSPSQVADEATQPLRGAAFVWARSERVLVPTKAIAAATLYCLVGGLVFGFGQVARCFQACTIDEE